MGKPIVATSNEGYASVVTDGKEGLLVPPKNTKALAEALKTLIEDERLRKKFGENGLAAVKEYDWSIIARRIIDYYEQASKKLKQDSVPADTRFTTGTPV
jgi:phosphatidylinositol alpha-mannosyltransferase